MTDIKKRPRAEVAYDEQHGPIVSVTIEGQTVSVYLASETGIYTNEENQQAGIEVTGPWYAFREALAAYHKGGEG